MNGNGAVQALAVSICALLAVALGKLGVTMAFEPHVPVAGRPVVAMRPLATEPPTTTTTTTTSTTTTIPKTTTSVARPAPTAAPPVTVPPGPPPVATPVASLSQRCTEALRWAAAHGLPLPAGWDYRCPDPARGGNGEPHWGTACINMPGICPATAYVAINIELIGPSDATLHYVVAHEICHAIEVVATGTTTEPSADACAAAHGAPRP